MVYDPELADRLRDLLEPEPGITEKRMFGGLAFLIDGHMSVTASREGGLLLRVDPADTERLLAEEHTGRFVMRGKPMDGWLRVDPPAIETDEQLERWAAIGVAYARTLPLKGP